MDTYFSKLYNCIVYIDDLLLYSKTYDEQIYLLEAFIDIVDNSEISLSQKSRNYAESNRIFMNTNR